MNFYPHHIGDFLKDTNFMSNEEQMIYLKLIWLYYDTEKPLPKDIFVLSMKCNCRDNETVLNGILEMFFKSDGDIWRHTRCDAEITKYHDIIAERSRAGKSSAAKRALKRNSTSVEQVFNKRTTNSQQNSTNQEPRTNNQEPVNLKNKDTRVPRFDAQAHLVGMGVDAQIASDWITLRRAKKAPPTLRAIAGIANEAIRAGRPLPDVLEACCNRGWTGFKAEWLQSDKPINGKTHHQVIQDAQTRAIFGDSFGVGEKLVTGEIVQ